MALKPFNSVAGFSVGEVPATNIILANGDITASNATFTGNLFISNTTPSFGIFTDNLYYSNGVAWDLQEAAGSNNQIQFNTNNNFSASANFTFDPITNLLTVAGNINAANADLGNLVTANFVNVASNLTSNNITVTNNVSAAIFNASSTVTSNNLTVNVELSGNTANFSGNIAALNANLGNLATANFVNVASNLNANIVNAANGVVASTLTSNVTTGTAPLTVTSTTKVSNLNADFLDGYDSSVGVVANTVVVRDANGNVSANFFIGDGSQLTGIDTSLIQNGTSNVRIAVADGSVNTSVNGNANIFVVTSTGANVNGYTTVSGNLTAANANLGNLVEANFVNVASNVLTSNLTVNTSISGNTANFSGNVVVPNLTVNSAISGNTANFSGNITALNANLGNLVIANFVNAETLFNGNSNVVINANANVVITATSNAVITVSGSGANITGYVTANGVGTFGGVESNTVTAQAGNLTLYAATGDNYIELRPTGNGQVDVGNFRIESLQNPINAQDAATKFYVDTVAEGLHVHASCGAATPDTLANVSVGTVTYNNGTAGVGATLVTTGTYTLIDGVNVASVGFRILVKDEANLAHNGIYVYTDSTTLTRANDFDTAPEIQGGDFTFVTGGTIYDSTGWVQIDNVTTVGTDPIEWQQFSGAGAYTAGQGLTLTGTVFSVNTDGITTEIAGGNVVVKANAIFTTPNIGAATGTSLEVTGNIVGNNIAANSLTSSGNLAVNGNIIANNISANANLVVNNATVNLELSGNTANFTGSIIAANISANANLVVNNATVNLELSGNTANFTGNITAANANLGNLVTANFFTGVLVNGTSNVTVNNNGNVNLSAGGNTTAVITSTGANITGYANVTGNVSANNITVTNDINANIANIATRIDLGNTDISWATVTTTSVSANQTIASFSITSVTGIEFLVKGVDATGSKYSVATVQAVTNGTSVDYATYGTVNLGGLTGVLAVNVVGSDLVLQVSPASSNSTVWTTQFRTI